MKFNAWWEESLDGLTNFDHLVVALADDSDESHPLVGIWGSKEEVIDEAESLGVSESDINFEE